MAYLLRVNKRNAALAVLILRFAHFFLALGTTNVNLYFQQNLFSLRTKLDRISIRCASSMFQFYQLIQIPNLYQTWSYLPVIMPHTYRSDYLIIFGYLPSRHRCSNAKISYYWSIKFPHMHLLFSIQQNTLSPQASVINLVLLLLNFVYHNTFFGCARDRYTRQKSYTHTHTHKAAQQSLVQ